MFARYKTSMFKVVTLLRELEANPTDYELLLRLQRALVARIKRAERRVAALKQERHALIRLRRTGRQSKTASQALNERASALSQAVDAAQQLQFIWRCFGDAIAFIYLDKYAVKHMLYNAHDYAIKESAGALSDKKGFKLEWSIVRSLAKERVPTVLVRHARTPYGTGTFASS